MSASKQHRHLISFSSSSSSSEKEEVESESEKQISITPCRSRRTPVHWIPSDRQLKACCKLLSKKSERDTSSWQSFSQVLRCKRPPIIANQSNYLFASEEISKPFRSNVSLTYGTPTKRSVHLSRDLCKEDGNLCSKVSMPVSVSPKRSTSKQEIICPRYMSCPPKRKQQYEPSVIKNESRFLYKKEDFSVSPKLRNDLTYYTSKSIHSQFPFEIQQNSISQYCSQCDVKEKVSRKSWKNFPQPNSTELAQIQTTPAPAYLLVNCVSSPPCRLVLDLFLTKLVYHYCLQANQLPFTAIQQPSCDPIISLFRTLQKSILNLVKQHTVLGGSLTHFCRIFRRVHQNWLYKRYRLQNFIASWCCVSNHGVSQTELSRLCRVCFVLLVSHNLRLTTPCCFLKRVVAFYPSLLPCLLTNILKGFCGVVSGRLYVLQALCDVVQCFDRALQETLQDAQTLSHEDLHAFCRSAQRSLGKTFAYLMAFMKASGDPVEIARDKAGNLIMQNPYCLFCTQQLRYRTKVPKASCKRQSKQLNLASQLSGVMHSLLNMIKEATKKEYLRNCIAVYISQFHWMAFLSLLERSPKNFFIVFGFSIWILGTSFNTVWELCAAPWKSELYHVAQIVCDAAEFQEGFLEFASRHSRQCFFYSNAATWSFSSSSVEALFQNFESSWSNVTCPQSSHYDLQLQMSHMTAELMLCMDMLFRYFCYCCNGRGHDSYLKGCDENKERPWNHKISGFDSFQVSISDSIPYGIHQGTDYPIVLHLHLSFILFIICIWIIVAVYIQHTHETMLNEHTRHWSPTFGRVVLRLLYQFVLRHSLLVSETFPCAKMSSVNSVIMLLTWRYASSKGFISLNQRLQCLSFPLNSEELMNLLRKHSRSESNNAYSSDSTCFPLHGINAFAEKKAESGFLAIQKIFHETQFFSLLLSRVVWIIFETLTLNQGVSHGTEKRECASDMASQEIGLPSVMQSMESSSFLISTLLTFAYLVLNLPVSCIQENGDVLIPEKLNPSNTSHIEFQDSLLGTNSCFILKKNLFPKARDLTTLTLEQGEYNPDKQCQVRQQPCRVSICCCTLWLWTFCYIKYRYQAKIFTLHHQYHNSHHGHNIMQWSYEDILEENTTTLPNGKDDNKQQGPMQSGKLFPLDIAMHCLDFLAQHRSNTLKTMYDTSTSVQLESCNDCPLNVLFEGCVKRCIKKSIDSASCPKKLTLKVPISWAAVLRSLVYFEALCCVSYYTSFLTSSRWFYFDIVMNPLKIVLSSHHSLPSQRPVVPLLLQKELGFLLLKLLDRCLSKKLSGPLEQRNRTLLFFRSLLMEVSSEWFSISCIDTSLLENINENLKISTLLRRIMKLFLVRIHWILLTDPHNLPVMDQYVSGNSHVLPKEGIKSSSDDANEYFDNEIQHPNLLCSSDTSSSALDIQEACWVLTSIEYFLATLAFVMPEETGSNLKLFFSKASLYFFPSSIPNPFRFTHRASSPLLPPSIIQLNPSTPSDPYWLHLARSRARNIAYDGKKSQASNLFQPFNALCRSLSYAEIFHDSNFFTGHIVEENQGLNSQSCREFRPCHVFPHFILPIIYYSVFFVPWDQLFIDLSRIFSRLGQLSTENSFVYSRVTSCIILDSLQMRLNIYDTYEISLDFLANVMSTVFFALISLVDPLKPTVFQSTTSCANVHHNSGVFSAPDASKGVESLFIRLRLATLFHLNRSLRHIIEWIQEFLIVFEKDPSYSRHKSYFISILEFFTSYSINELRSINRNQFSKTINSTMISETPPFHSRKRCTDMTINDVTTSFYSWILSEIQTNQLNLNDVWTSILHHFQLVKEHSKTEYASINMPSYDSSHSGSLHCKQQSGGTEMSHGKIEQDTHKLSPYASLCDPNKKVIPQRRICPQILTHQHSRPSRNYHFPTILTENSDTPNVFCSMSDSDSLESVNDQNKWIVFDENDLSLISGLTTRKKTASLEHALNECHLDPYWSIYISDMFHRSLQ